MEKISVFVENVFSGLPKTKEVIDMKREIQSNMEEHYLELIRQGKDEDAAFGIVAGEFGSIEDIRHELNLDEYLYNEQDLPLESDNPLMLEFEKKFRNGIIAGVVCCIIGVFGTAIIGELFDGSTMSEGLELAWFMVFVCIGVVFFIYWGMEKDRLNKNGIAYDHEIYDQAPKNRKKTRNIVFGILTNTAILWQITVLAYLVMGLFFGLWHPGWVIFIVAGIITSIVNMFF